MGARVEGLFFLAALWLLVGPIAALIVAIVSNSRVADVTKRLAALEEQLAAAPAARLAEPAPSAAASTAASEETPRESAVATAAEETAPAAELPTATGPWAEPRTVQPQAPAPEPELVPIAAAVAARGTLETLEGKIGARWSVLVGGLALALGAIFLVRYSIEQGLIGPAMRIALGFLLAAALLAAGEVLRRRDRALNAPIFAKADVPAILTGAGGLAALRDDLCRARALRLHRPGRRLRAPHRGRARHACSCR